MKLRDLFISKETKELIKESDRLHEESERLIKVAEEDLRISRLVLEKEERNET